MISRVEGTGGQGRQGGAAVGGQGAEDVVGEMLRAPVQEGGGGCGGRGVHDEGHGRCHRINVQRKQLRKYLHQGKMV